MQYFKIIPYVYLAAGLFFIYTGIVKYGEDDEGFWIWFVIALLSVFMFFFRMRFAKKFSKNRSNEKR